MIWKGDFLKVQRLLAASEQQLVDGVQIRCRGSLDFYAPGGRLQLCVREVDPAFTLGLLERRRRETLAALTAAGLLEKNRALPLCRPAALDRPHHLARQRRLPRLPLGAGRRAATASACSSSTPPCRGGRPSARWSRRSRRSPGCRSTAPC